MKNAYDNFANEYSKSQGEKGDYYHRTQIDLYIYKLLGNPKGKKIYDVGCGNGYMARNLAKKGAIVIASDISDKLIQIASKKSKGLGIKYFTSDATDISKVKDEKFDVVVLNMVVNYIKNLDRLFEGVSKILKKGGMVIFSTNHPIRPAYPYSYWEKGKIKGKDKLFIKTTDYLKNISFKVKSSWDQKTELDLVNRPFGEYINTLSKKGLYVSKLYEPESKGFAKDFSENLRNSHHIPTFIIFGALKIK